MVDEAITRPPSMNATESMRRMAMKRARM